MASEPSERLIDSRSMPSRVFRPFALAASCAVVACALGACEAAPGPEPASPTPPAANPAAVVVHSVDWAALGPIDAEVLARLDGAARDAVAKAPVPVLVPRWEAELARAIVLAKEGYYAFSYRDEGVTVSLSGNRVAKVYPHVPPHRGTTTVRGQGGFVSQNEGIWAARWIEGGVSYALDVECASHTDSRCADEGYVRALAEKLAYVGGEGAR